MQDRNEIIENILTRHQDSEGSLLPILHEIQDFYGYIPSEAIATIAKSLNLTRADVHGVISFYHDFRTQPPGKHILRICRAEACQAMGGRTLAQSAQKRLALNWHETSKDNMLTLEPVYCLGLCANAPAAMLDGQLLSELDEETLAASIEKVQL